MSTFAASMTLMARLSDVDMSRSWKWQGDGLDLGVRDGFHRSLEAELAQLSISEAAAPASEPTIAMAQAQRALGQVLSLLAGQPEELLDFQAGPPEWPLREVVRHILETELSFFANTRWSVTRVEDEPVAMPKELRPGPDDAPGEGTVEDLTTRLAAARARTNALVMELGPADLERPSVWAGHPVDVRFRLHRFASHLVEHEIHAGKVLRAAGHPPGEARQMVRAIWAARGGHELRSPAASLVRLDQELGERVGSFGLEGGGGPQP